MEPKFISGKPVEIEIGSPTKQGSNGRICLPLTMPLSDGNVKGMPDWLSEGYAAVCGSAKKFVPDVQQIADILVCFNREKADGAMFPTPDAKIPNAELKGFLILRVGDADDFDVALKFTLYAPFNREFWTWVGEMAGEKSFIGFPKDLAKSGGAVAQGSAKTGTVETAPAAASPAPAPADKPKGPGLKVLKGDDLKPSRSGKEMAAYNEKKTAEEEARPN